MKEYKGYREVKTVKDMLYNEKKAKYYKHNGIILVITEYLFIGMAAAAFFLLEDLQKTFFFFVLALCMAFVGWNQFSKFFNINEHKNDNTIVLEDEE